MRRKRAEGALSETVSRCIVDVHPDRPIARGIAPGPNYDKVICAIPPDPTFEAIEEAGGLLEKHSEGHAVANGTVWVSGEIPRITDYEAGILGGQRWVEERTNGEQKGEWVSENVIGVKHFTRIVFFSAFFE